MAGLNFQISKIHLSKDAMILAVGLLSGSFTTTLANRGLPVDYQHIGAVLGGSLAAGGISAWWVDSIYGQK